MKNVMLLLMLIGCFVAPKQALVAQDAKQVLNKSIAAIDNAKTLKYRMKFKERLVSGWMSSPVRFRTW